MSISISFIRPEFRHTHVLKMAGSEHIVHCVEVQDASGYRVSINFTGLNDRQRQLAYELFGPVIYEDETAPGAADIEEAETI